MAQEEHRVRTQVVDQFNNGEHEVEQKVILDLNDGWLVVEHAQDQISISLENWEKLKVLVTKTIAGDEAN